MSGRISQPETLQDLCVFHCINNLGCLSDALSRWKLTDNDRAQHSSTLLCSKLLDYYLEYHVRNYSTQTIIDELLKNRLLCNSLSLNRRGMLMPENIVILSRNVHTLKYLDVAVYIDTEFVSELYALIQNNLKSLSSITIGVKGNERACEQLMDSISNTTKHGFKSGMSDVAQDVKCDSTPAKTRFRPSAMTITEACVHSTDDRQVSAMNLRSFTYDQHYNKFREREEDSNIFSHILKLLETNRNLQLLTIVSTKTVPIVSFLPSTVLYTLTNLRSLVLSSDINLLGQQVIPLNMFVNLPQLKQLQHLDISCGGMQGSSDDSCFKVDEATQEAFKMAVLQMQLLKSLDVSGTNLTEMVCHADSEKDSECTQHCMPGFEGRQFEYLGLFCSDASSHKFIPAIRVSGNHTEEQLLVALWSHQHNRTLMIQVLREIKLLITSYQTNMKHGTQMFEALIAYLDKIPDWDIQFPEARKLELPGLEGVMTCMYYLLRYKTVKEEFTLKQRRQLLDRLLVICSNCTRDLGTIHVSVVKDRIVQVVRLSLLLVLILDLDRITPYCYSFEKYVGVLIRLVQSDISSQVLMLVLRLLHNACRFSQELKVVIGQKLNLVKVLQDCIIENVAEGGNTDILGKMWSILWTLTDEVQINCELFVAFGGCDHALFSIDEHMDDDDLLRKITGAMCNVSEVPHLRPQLMTQSLVQKFRELLEILTEDNYDVSSHAAAYLVLLAAEGPEAWSVPSPTREEILQAIDTVITDRWSLTKPKGVKFRSLAPMTKQLDNFSTPTAQFWATWMICNLVLVKPDCYCSMVENENILEIIESCLLREDLRQDVRDLMILIRDKTLIFFHQKP